MISKDENSGLLDIKRIEKARKRAKIKRWHDRINKRLG